jgi:hypothetical protein
MGVTCALYIKFASSSHENALTGQGSNPRPRSMLDVRSVPSDRGEQSVDRRQSVKSLPLLVDGGRPDEFRSVPRYEINGKSKLVGGLEGMRLGRAAGERGFLLRGTAIALKNSEACRFDERSCQSSKLIASNWSAQMKANISHGPNLILLGMGGPETALRAQRRGANPLHPPDLGFVA